MPTPPHTPGSRRARVAARTASTAAALLAALALPPGSGPGGSLAAQGVGGEAAPARVSWHPARPVRGALVRIAVRPTAAGSSGDSVVAVRGTLAGEPLHFEWTGGRWRAFGGIPVSSFDSIAVPLVLERADGRVDSVAASIALPAKPPEPKRGASRLRVAERFGREPDPEEAARLRRETEQAMAVARAAHDTPRLWSAPFRLPRASRVTSRFGAGRVFNGAVQSTHGGVDFAGATGATVRAANRGVVRLVAGFLLAGNAVYIDHGGGLVTGYFHLSRALVAPGDTVARGQPVGEVGATGRVTGPHLHWMARYGGVTVDPLSVVEAVRE
jgi:murein DD-endopeptidase MepM/ murein hydrolase activator NlpD